MLKQLTSPAVRNPRGVFTSEFAVWFLTDLGLLCTALAGQLSPRWAAIAAAIATAAYTISRGLAKKEQVGGGI